MIVCHCGVVNDRAVASAVDGGARTLAGVCRTTGAGQQCGTCVFSSSACCASMGRSVDRSMHGGRSCSQLALVWWSCSTTR